MDLERLKADLIRDEGKKLHAYRDTNGFYTIGVGHLLGTIPRMLDITDDECDALLERDIRNAQDATENVFCLISLTKLDEVRYRALINMTFNRGEEHMQSSTTITPAIRSALAGADWSFVGVAIRQSPWAKQIGQRAERLAYMFETGKDPN